MSTFQSIQALMQSVNRCQFNTAPYEAQGAKEL